MLGELDQRTARERFEHSFPSRRHVLLIAIHVSPEPSVWQADTKVAYAGGADGIIVIRDYNTLATNEDVLVAYNWARGRYWDWWIGINLLGYAPIAAITKVRSDTSGVWFDDARLDECDPTSAAYLKELRRNAGFVHLPRSPLIMPSVAMKYVRPNEDIAIVAKMAEPYADVVLTSSEGTGTPPSFEKVRKLREAVEIPIGICSGIDVDNVVPFLDLGVEVFIVNTSLNTNGRLDPVKMRALRTAIPQK